MRRKVRQGYGIDDSSNNDPEDDAGISFGVREEKDWKGKKSNK